MCIIVSQIWNMEPVRQFLFIEKNIVILNMETFAKIRELSLSMTRRSVEGIFSD